MSAYAAILVKGAHRRVPTARLFGFVVLADLWSDIVGGPGGLLLGSGGGCAGGRTRPLCLAPPPTCAAVARSLDGGAAWPSALRPSGTPASLSRVSRPDQAPSAIRSIRPSVARASPIAVWSPPGSFWLL